MASDRTRDLVLPLAVLASVAVGALLGSLFARTDPGPTTAATSPGDSKELVEALQALRAEMVRDRELRAESPASTAGLARTPAPQPDAAATSELARELRAATADLVASGEAMRQAADRARAERAPLVFPEAPPDPALLDAVAAATYDVNGKAYMLWTYQQIIDRFGKPESTTHGDAGIGFMYRTKSGRYVYFTFQDGRVWQVSTSG